MSKKDIGLYEIITNKKISMSNTNLKYLLIGTYLGIILNHMDLWLNW